MQYLFTTPDLISRICNSTRFRMMHKSGVPLWLAASLHFLHLALGPCSGNCWTFLCKCTFYYIVQPGKCCTIQCCNACLDNCACKPNVVWSKPGPSAFYLFTDLLPILTWVSKKIRDSLSRWSQASHESFKPFTIHWWHAILWDFRKQHEIILF